MHRACYIQLSRATVNGDSTIKESMTQTPYALTETDSARLSLLEPYLQMQYFRIVSKWASSSDAQATNMLDH